MTSIHLCVRVEPEYHGVTVVVKGNNCVVSPPLPLCESPALNSDSCLVARALLAELSHQPTLGLALIMLSLENSQFTSVVHFLQGLDQNLCV